MEAIGAVDEANSAIGLAVAMTTPNMPRRCSGSRTTCSTSAPTSPRRGRI
jgi:hypothetical protein